MKADLEAARGEVKRLAASQASMMEMLKQLKQKPTREGEGDKKKCFICGGDHIAKNCPHKLKNKEAGAKEEDKEE